MRFTERLGFRSSEKLVQRESMDDDLRNSLWNAVTLVYWDRVSYKPRQFGMTKHSNMRGLITGIWLHFFKKPVDEIPSRFHETVRGLRAWYFNADWGDCYDFVEFVANAGQENAKEDFIKIVNSYLERENSAYRFVAGQLTEITSQEEIEAVEAAISGPYAGVKAHLKTALTLMNDKSNPDFRNSIKESISAVESLAKVLTDNDKATLGQALKVIERDGGLHKGLKSAFSSLYGYTNDADGIRHALLEESSLHKADARFMLVSCSAFINYLIDLESG